MAAKLCYRIQPAGTELGDECPSQGDEGHHGGRPVYRLLDDLWEAVLLSRQGEWQPEIVEIECQDCCPAARSAREGTAERRMKATGDQAAEAACLEPAARITRRRQFESWDEILDLAWRVYRGVPTVADRERLGWTLPAVVVATFYDHRPCWPIPPESVEGWMNGIMDCRVCHRKHTPAAGCNQAVLDAIDRAHASDRDPVLERRRSFHDRGRRDAGRPRRVTQPDKSQTVANVAEGKRQPK